MSELKPCPFCGEQVFPPLTSSFDDSYTRCGFCGAMMPHNRWQTRPIEDDLNKRIVELEEDKGSLLDSNLWLKQNYEDLERDYGVMHEKMCARIDKLKGAIEILEDQMREAKNILIDKRLHIDSLYEDGFKLQKRIAELESIVERLIEIVDWATKTVTMSGECS